MPQDTTIGHLFLFGFFFGGEERGVGSYEVQSRVLWKTASL